MSLRQVGSNLFGRAMMIPGETYRVGADTGRVMYAHDSEEGGGVVSGRVEITVGSQRRIPGPGDACYFDSRNPHRFRQVGPEECVIISACTPPTFRTGAMQEPCRNLVQMDAFSRASSFRPGRRAGRKSGAPGACHQESRSPLPVRAWRICPKQAPSRWIFPYGGNNRQRCRSL